MPRYFSVEDANSKVPQLTEIFRQMMQFRVQLKILYKKLDAAGFAPQGSDPESLESPLPKGTPASVARDRAVFKALVETTSALISDVTQLGAIIKDVESGLCDFLARKNGEEIQLCWRFGESSIEYWHDMERGFSGRREITEEDRLLIASAAGEKLVRGSGAPPASSPPVH